MRMALAITPLHPHIGAEIGGLDLSRPIDDEIVAELWRAIDRYAVLVFHGQQISDRQLRSEEHTSELQSHSDLVCRLLLEKKNKPNLRGNHTPSAAGNDQSYDDRAK